MNARAQATLKQRGVGTKAVRHHYFSKCDRCQGKGFVKVLSKKKPVLHETIVGDDYRLDYRG